MGSEETVLVACPFCGGAAELIEHDQPCREYRIHCRDSEEACWMQPKTRWFVRKAKAIHAWNVRVEPHSGDE